MKKKRSVGVTLFGIILICISIIFLWVIQLADSIIYSYGLTIKIGKAGLFGWLVPALLGIGILRLSDFFRIVTICISAIFVFWTPIMYFYSRMMFERTSFRLPLFTKYEIIDIFLIIFGLGAIYFFTRPKVKEQFK